MGAQFTARTRYDSRPMTSQRTYRAACPNCGAPVEFRSAGSAMAVCSYCSSTILRDGDALRRIGSVAELFDDHSPIILGASGTLPDALATPNGQTPGAAFVVAGRLQYRYSDGIWSEWSLLLDDGSTLWLSEDNGRYALSRNIGGAAAADVPAFGRLSDGSLAPGRPLSLGGKRYEISSIVRVVVHSAAGELPGAAQRVASALSASAQAVPTAAPLPGHWIVEARSADASIASIDYADAAAPALTIGMPVALRDLAWRDLATDSSATLSARSFACPSCGSPVSVTLSGTQSIVCPACAAVVDLSAGQGADLQHFRQLRRYTSPLPLGGSGRLADVDWQAVGFARRSGHDEDGYDFAWSEVLLYHRTEGFAFLVVASDGVSFVRTVQGAPQTVGDRVARFDGRTFRAESRYTARVDYVEGEFYWQVRRDQRTRNIDYVSGDQVLSREEEALGRRDAAGPGPRPDAGGGIRQSEVVWSHGQRVNGVAVARAFGLASLASGPASGVPIAPGNLSLIDAPAYDPNDMPKGLGTAAGAAVGAAAGSSAGGGLATADAAAAESVARASLGGASPTSGSRAIIWLIVIVVIVLVIALMLADDDDEGGGGFIGGRSGGYSGAHK